MAATVKEFTCKEGLLLKEELKLGKWKKRWMVLRVNEKGDPSLYYYKVDDYINECMPLGFVIPSCCTLFEYPAKSFAFELVVPPSYNSLSPRPATHFRFQATNTDEFRSWMSVLGLYTMPIEDLQHLAQNGTDLVRSHSDESFGSPTPVLNRSPTQPRSRQWEDNEAVLVKLFPDVELQTIVDALEFCHGNRNDAIDLLAEQNKLSSSEGAIIAHSLSGQSPPAASFGTHSDPSSVAQKFVTQGLARLPFSWHRTQSPTLIPDPTQLPLSPSTELQKELLMLDAYNAQASETPSPAPLQRPTPIRPSPTKQLPSLSPHQSPHQSPQNSPSPPVTQQVTQPVQPQEPAEEKSTLHHSRRFMNLQQLVIPSSPQISHTPTSETPSTPPSLNLPSSSPSSLPAPDFSPSPNPPYPHYTHYQQTRANNVTYQPLVSPHTPEPSPQLIPKLSLQQSPLISPRSPTPPSSAASHTPTTPTSPMSPTSPPASPRLHQYFNRYQQSAPSHTLRHFEAYSASPEDASSYQCHSHPQYSSGFTYNLTGYGPHSPSNSFTSLRVSGENFTGLPSLKQTPPSPLAFRIVGATRNTYYMDYIVEVITPELRWLVYRRYSNFSLLNAKLLKLGLAHPTKNVMPPKQFSLPPLASPFASDDLVQKRIDGLGSFLNSLVHDHSHFFLNHPIGQTFLDPHITSSDHNKIVNNIIK